MTTSSKLMLRKDCPGGAYHVSASMSNNLELCLVHMLRMHGVVLEPAKFLTRCVVCNGKIEKVTDLNEKRRIFADNQAPDLSSELDAYACDSCGQGYWWSDRPTSSASRVKNQATQLFEMCLRGGVPIKGDLHMFDFVDVEAQRLQGLTDAEQAIIGTDQQAVVEWLRKTDLACPTSFESAYALKDKADNVIGERHSFTNVTSHFVGLLDYVWFEPAKMSLSKRLYIPTSFKTLKATTPVENGHLLPSDIWPSDHLAVGAELTFKTETASFNEFGVFSLSCACLGNNMFLPLTPDRKHTVLCGDTPPSLSLFQMAELRKKARLEKEKKQGKVP